MNDQPRPRLLEYAQAFLLNIPAKTDPISWGLKAIVLIGLLLWGLTFTFHSVASNYAAESFLHGVNLIFHEAGHVVFSPFGRFLTVLGGTLGQLLIPAIVTLTFILKERNPYGAAVGLWWLGQNFLDIAPYINDARDLDLPLLGGVTGKDVVDYHDWEYLLHHTGLIYLDHALARFAHYYGSFLMLGAVAWAGYILWRQYGTIENKWQ